MEIDDARFMEIALQQARTAMDLGEVPVGAVVVRDGEVIGRGANTPISSHDPSAHAEVVAIRDAARAERNYRLPGTTVYVTLEPCLMCVGVLIHARVSRLVFGAPEPKTGAIQSAAAILEDMPHNHTIEVCSGVLEDDCRDLVRSFFEGKR